MFNKKSKTICFIPARKGSTRLKNKNLRKINNVSLTEITINQAKKSGVFKDIILSSDSNLILDIGRKLKISCHKRNKLNSTKYSTTDSALLETIKKIKYQYDNIIILQVTSPLRNFKTIKNFLNFCIKKKIDTCLTASLIDENLANFNKKFFNPINNKRKRSQDRKKYLYENGLIYFISKKFFEKNNKIYPNHNWNYFLTDKYEYIDIDNYTDYKVCKTLYNKLNQ